MTMRPGYLVSLGLLCGIVATGQVPGQSLPALPQPAQPEPARIEPQPDRDPPGNMDRGAPTIDELLTRARAAYRSGPIGERIRFDVIAGGETVTSEVSARLDASLRGSRRLALRLGPLRALAIESGDSTTLSALHDDDARSFFRATESEPLSIAVLERQLPPIALPQLWLALEDDAPLGAPFLDNADAEPPHPLEIAGRAHWVVQGRSGPATAEFAFDAETFRLSRAVIGLGDAAGTIIQLRAVPFDPGPASGWTLDVSDREPLASVSEFRVRPPMLVQGDAINDWRFQALDGTPWSPERRLLEAGPEPPRPVLAMVVADFADPSAPRRAVHGAEAVEAAAAMLGAMRTRRLEAGAIASRVALHPAMVAVFDAASFDRSVLTELFRAAPPDPAPLTMPLAAAAWTTARAQTLERLPGDAAAHVVVIDHHQRFVGAVPVPAETGADAALDLAAEVASLVAAWEWPDLPDDPPADRPAVTPTDPAQNEQEPSDPPGS